MVSDTKAVLLKQGVSEPNDEQLKEALEHVEEEHHAIVFLYKCDKHRYGKLIEDIENEVLQKKDLFSLQKYLTFVMCWQDGKTDLTVSATVFLKQKWNCLCH